MSIKSDPGWVGFPKWQVDVSSSLGVQFTRSSNQPLPHLSHYYLNTWKNNTHLKQLLHWREKLLEWCIVMDRQAEMEGTSGNLRNFLSYIYQLKSLERIYIIWQKGNTNIPETFDKKTQGWMDWIKLVLSVEQHVRFPHVVSYFEDARFHLLVLYLRLFYTPPCPFKSQITMREEILYSRQQR